MLKPCFAAAALTALLAPAIAAAGDLVVTVENVESADGKVLVGVHTKSADFPDDASRITGNVQAAAAGKVTVRFSGLKAGRYAVATYHDANGNGEMDANMVGMPTEGYGFSNNAAGSFGPPSFDAAAFDIPESGVVETAIKLTY